MAQGLYSKAIVRVAWDEFLEQAPSLLPGGNLVRVAAKILQEVAKAEAEAEAGERLTGREVERLINEDDLAACPGISEPDKTKLRNAFLSEIGLLLKDLQQAEEEEARRIAVAEATARREKVAELTSKLAENLKAKNYDDAWQIANAILRIDPRNRDAKEAEKHCSRRRSEWFDGGSAARGFLIFLVVLELSWQLSIRSFEGWAGIVVFAIVLCIFSCIFSLTEKYWARLPRWIRRPANWIFNAYALLVVAHMLWSYVFAF
jgi:hypothetical protein